MALALGVCLLPSFVFTAPAIAQQAQPLPFIGVNIAGAEFKGSRIPGEVNKDYVYPSAEDMNAFIDMGLTTIRLPFRWERLQRNLGWPLDDGELKRIQSVVDHMTGRGGHVVLDPHNYGRYFGRVIGSAEVPDAAFAEFWAKLAATFKNNPGVIFGLMNEPHGIDADRWRQSAETALRAIRASGARNLVLVPGTAWSGAHSWFTRRSGRSNAEALADLEDPAGAMAFEVHQYLDADFSGTRPTCRNETVGVRALERMTVWLREGQRRAFLGEFAGGDDPVCLAALSGMLAHMQANPDVWIGWTYWAAGRWWGDYPFSVQPGAGEARPAQLELLRRFAGNAGGLVTRGTQDEDSQD